MNPSNAPFLKSAARAVLTLLAVAGTALAAERPNILFIAVDDLRPELNCYGRTHIHSPNIDRLAASGTIFERAYCMVPTCGASRASLMTGIRPAQNRFINYLAWAEKDAPGITTLNTHFKQHGYTTVSLGKIFHHPTDNLGGWSERPWRPRGGLAMQYNVPENRRIHAANSNRKERPDRGPPVEAGEVEDDAYPDGQIALEAVRRLKRLAARDEPFLLAVGFLKPHLPFNCPKKYWDLYDPDSIRLPDNYREPENAPPGAVHTFGELRAYDGIPAKGLVDESTAKRLIHGYYACVSYTDAQVGKVLDALKETGAAENTIIVLWGDHGWNLGDHTIWCKHSCFESSLHAPLILSAPGYKGGQNTRGLTEFIDIYPSLCELAGLPLPDHLQGRSFVPLLISPDQEWKPFAISRYQNGDSIRTDTHRFTQYWRPNGAMLGRMLYDHRTDGLENVNAAADPENAVHVDRLFQQLKANMGRPNP